MVYVGLSLFLFTAIVAAHVVFYRRTHQPRTVLSETAIVFTIGIIADILAISYLSSVLPVSEPAHLGLFGMPIPATAIIFYILLNLLYGMFFATIYLGDISPSSKIYLLLRQSKGMPLMEIQEYFSEEELVTKRVRDLEAAGLIRKLGERYCILPRGKRLMRLFDAYRALYQWDRGG
jgi:hypothetical protein